MARLIDADKFIEYLGLDAENSREENLGEIVTLEDFDRQPTVDAEPVRRGKWIDVGSGFNYHFECSECGWKDGYPFNDRHKYCPNCGAKMEES